MVRVGVAGIGFMGWIHWLAYAKTDRATVAAIATRDEKKRAGDWRGIQGNFGPPGEQVDLANVTTYADFDEMVSDPSLDVIDICLPPHLHADAIRKAIQAGKHVLCEKPLTVDSETASELVAEANQAGKQLMVAQVLPFFPEFSFAYQCARENRYGKLLGGYFKRIISDPLWLKDFYDPKLTGGPLIDLHVHDAHFVRLLFGMPGEVVSKGRMRGEVVEFCHTLFGFADPNLAVASTCGVINQQGRSFTHGFELQFEKASLQFEFAACGDESEVMPLKVFDADGNVTRPEMGDGDPVSSFVTEIEEMVGAIESGTTSEILDGELARDAIALCHHQTEAIRSGQIVRI